ncbi:archaeosortase A [Halocatena halophila]|uniref:archaeosortase A n=1 Tax=Halocatena halophila TaxID=2814576 RepID=UPI002ED437D3
MIDALVGFLAWTHEFSPYLAWLTVGGFVLGGLSSVRNERIARPVTVASWGLFGLFWLTLIHYYLITQKSAIEGVGCLLAVPLSVYAGLLLWQGRTSLYVLSRAIGAMGLVFLPFEAIPVLTQTLIETVTYQTEFLMGLLGQSAPGAFRVVSGAVVDQPPYRSTFLFVDGSGHTMTYTIRLACTGLGSMAIFGGLILAVEGTVRQKARALVVSIPVIYGLNLVRNVFIGLTFGQQRLHVAPELIMGLFGTSDPYRVSYYLADRIIAQSLSVFILVAITWLVVRQLPGTLRVVEDILFLLTRTEYELAARVEDAEPSPAD